MLDLLGPGDANTTQFQLTTALDLDALVASPDLNSGSESSRSSDFDLLQNIQAGRFSRLLPGKELGRGGMATVFETTDTGLKRQVAVKVLHEYHLQDGGTADDDRSPLRRFVDEALITGQLEHPNIPPVHDLGVTEDGQVYFTMKRVVGQSLRDVLDGIREGDDRLLKRYDTYAFCDILLKVCAALSFAHSRNVIHRDLKPDNIMIGRFGEVQVMDWGLAKILTGTAARADGRSTDTAINISLDGGEASETIQGTISGTPAYMAPEQARGDTSKIDTRADVFLLGALLYELLTFVPPFHSDSSLSALKRAQDFDLLSPQAMVESLSLSKKLADDSPVCDQAIRRARSFPPPLAAIAVKALAESPDDRYQTVNEMALDIERFLRGESISVYQEPLSVRVAKWIGRNRVVASAVFATLTVGLLSLTVIFALGRSLADERADSLQRENLMKEQDAERSEREYQRARDEMERLQRRSEAAAHVHRATDSLWRAANSDDPVLAQAVYREVIRQLSQAIQADPTYAVAYLWRGKVSLELGDLGDCIADLREGNRLLRATGQPVDVSSLMMAATAVMSQYQILGREDWHDDCVQLLQEVVDSSREDDKYHKLAAILIDAANTIAILNGGLADASNLVQLIRSLESVPERLREFSQKYPDLWEGTFMYGFFCFNILRLRYLKLDNPPTYNDVMKALRTSLKIRPHSPATLSALSEMLYDSNHPEAAREVTSLWKQFLERFDYDALGHYALARSVVRLPVYKELPELDVERSLLTSIERASGRNNAAMARAGSLLAFVYQRQGRTEDALNQYRATFQYERVAKRAGEFRIGGREDPAPWALPAVERYIHLLIATGRLEECLEVLRTSASEVARPGDPDAFETRVEYALDSIVQIARKEERLLALRNFHDSGICTSSYTKALMSRAAAECGDLAFAEEISRNLGADVLLMRPSDARGEQRRLTRADTLRGFLDGVAGKKRTRDRRVTLARLRINLQPRIDTSTGDISASMYRNEMVELITALIHNDPRVEPLWPLARVYELNWISAVLLNEMKKLDLGDGLPGRDPTDMELNLARALNQVVTLLQWLEPARANAIIKTELFTYASALVREAERKLWHG